MESNLDDQDFGAFPGLDKIRMLAEWAPLIARLQAVLSAESAHAKGKAIIQLALGVASKTPTPADDEALKHLAAILETAEGKALCEWVERLIGGGS